MRITDNKTIAREEEKQKKRRRASNEMKGRFWWIGIKKKHSEYE